MVHLLFLFLPFGFPDSPTGNIELNIPNLRNQKGSILISLFKNSEGFPSDPKKSLRSWKLPVSSKIVLPDVPSGKYAIAVMHDEDGNNTMTYNFMKLPKEGFAFSNHPATLLQMPEFEKALFSHERETTSLSLRLRY